jgi:hypothetical protein
MKCSARYAGLLLFPSRFCYWAWLSEPVLKSSSVARHARTLNRPAREWTPSLSGQVSTADFNFAPASSHSLPSMANISLSSSIAKSQTGAAVRGFNLNTIALTSCKSASRSVADDLITAQQSRDLMVYKRATRPPDPSGRKSSNSGML